MDDNKTYSLNLSAQMILGIILSVLVPIGGAVYYGITLFNDLTSTIEEVKKMSSVETRIIVLEDIQNIDWIPQLINATPNHLKTYIEIYDLRYIKGRWDDILFVINTNKL